jgi:hypothetical protein
MKKFAIAVALLAAFGAACAKAEAETPRQTIPPKVSASPSPATSHDPAPADVFSRPSHQREPLGGWWRP